MLAVVLPHGAGLGNLPSLELSAPGLFCDVRPGIVVCIECERQADGLRDLVGSLLVSKEESCGVAVVDFLSLSRRFLGRPTPELDVAGNLYFVWAWNQASIWPSGYHIVSRGPASSRKCLACFVGHQLSGTTMETLVVLLLIAEAWH